MMLPTSEDSSELRELISSYSELAARDSFTGLYSKKAMPTICCRKCLLFRKNS